MFAKISSLKNRLKYFILIFGVCILIITISSAFIQKHQHGSDPNIDGYVPDETTAIKIAEAIWLPIYGEEIYNYKPFKAELLDKKVWRVSGTVHTQLGGSPIAEIEKSDCKILKVIHEK
jgi:hypothetical protein